MTEGGTLLSRQPKERGGFLATDNVIDLACYRSRRATLCSHTVYYISECGEWTALFSGFTKIHLKDIRSQAVLEEAQAMAQPDLVFVEACIGWEDPVAIVKCIHEKFGVPIVMISQPYSKERAVVKRAYCAGSCDTLLAPLRKDELVETMDILLKLRWQASLYH